MRGRKLTHIQARQMGRLGGRPRCDAPKIGDRFGGWTVIGSPTYTGRACSLLCRCVCGQEQKVLRNNLRTNLFGCRQCASRNITERQPPVPQWFWSGLIANARARKILVSITREEAEQLLIEQKFRCALSGADISITRDSRKRSRTSASLDRINSLDGYRVGNVCWVHKKVNLMKGVLDLAEFLFWCSSIHLKNTENR